MVKQTSRKLSAAEKARLAAYGIPKIDLDNVTLHAGLPWFGIPTAAAITLENDVHFKTLPSAAETLSNPESIALIAHELIHVGQYRTGALTRAKYLLEATFNGCHLENKYEAPAYHVGDTIYAAECQKKKETITAPIAHSAAPKRRIPITPRTDAPEVAITASREIPVPANVPDSGSMGLQEIFLALIKLLFGENSGASTALASIGDVFKGAGVTHSNTEAHGTILSSRLPPSTTKNVQQTLG